MKIFKTSVFLLTFITISNADSIFTMKYFPQKVDHFNETDELFQQRYFENRAVFKNGSAIILFVGGMETAVPEFILGGPLLEVAVQNNASLIYLEHRYFGESLPFNGNLSTENLKYLTVENALEDITYFLKYLNQSIPEYVHSKVLLAGSSYSGALVMWHRIRRSGNTKGAWVSSPKTLSQPEIAEYKEAVNDLLIDKKLRDCKDHIHAGIEEMMYELNYLNSTNRIQQNFRLCKPIKTDDKYDIMNFFHTITSMISDELVKDDETMRRMCRTIETVKDKIMALALSIQPQILYEPCIDTSYSSAIFSYEYSNEERAKLYLQCKQLGWFKTGASRLQPFGYFPTMEYFVDLCQKVFDYNVTVEELNENSDAFNRKFGGLSTYPQKVFMTYGMDDVEQFLGPQKTIISSSTVRSIYIARQSHDLYWWTAPRTNEVQWANENGVRLMSQYLSSN